MNSRKNILSTAIAAVLLAGLSATPFALAQLEPDPDERADMEEHEYSGELYDAWLDGKIETAYALNRHLNPFRIDTKVENGMVYLSGTVESEIDRDLAGEIAMSVEGVREVDNQLEVGEEDDLADDDDLAYDDDVVDDDDLEGDDVEEASNDFMTAVSDATITATVKTKLLANDSVKGLAIDVDTEDSVVTLSGNVESDQIRDLAEALAQNTENVERVENNLEIIEVPGS